LLRRYHVDQRAHTMLAAPRVCNYNRRTCAISIGVDRWHASVLREESRRNQAGGDMQSPIACHE
jgi:hypothetical protein